MHVPTFVLLIEDDPDQAQVLVAGLESAGFRTECAADGSTGLTRIWQHLPDLVLLDIGVPRVNGALIGKAMRSDPKTAAIPIVFQSARPESEIRKDFADYDAYFHKPYELSKLVATVRRLVRVDKAEVHAKPAERRQAVRGVGNPRRKVDAEPKK